MTESAPILIPRENVNDESATLIVWEVADGSFVEAGGRVAQIETSKAVVEIVAPASGILHHEAKAGQDVPIGASIGRIGDSKAAPKPMTVPDLTTASPIRSNGSAANGSADPPVRPLAPSVRRLVAEENLDPDLVAGTGRGGRITKGDVVAYLASNAPAEPPPPPRSTRFSRKAREQMAALGLEASTFENRGLIRVRDLVPNGSASTIPSVTTPTPNPATLSERVAPAPRPVAASGVTTRREPLSRAKRTEGKYLRSGLESTLASVVTVACPTRGFRDAIGPDASPLIVFEAARLLRKYPAFNAYHDDGVAHYYDEVNVGFAVDAGRGLKVPIIRETDRKPVDSIASEMRDLVIAYLGDALPVEALSGGTFTLTDLSGEGVVAFHPLINRGQSAILGICAESIPEGGREGTFNLVLAFDHQLAEGRTAARFLGDLRDRLMAHEASASRSRSGPSSIGSAAVLRCSRCQTTHADLSASGHALIQTVRGDGSPRFLCVLCLEGWT